MGRQPLITRAMAIAFVLASLQAVRAQNATCIATALGELASSALLNTSARNDAYRDALLHYTGCLGVALSGKVCAYILAPVLSFVWACLPCGRLAYRGQLML
jgi:hypothetical protein